MGERRFVIKEIHEGEDPKSIYWITETELINRMNHVRKPEFITSQQAIDIMLHGCHGTEKEQIRHWQKHGMCVKCGTPWPCELAMEPSPIHGTLGEGQGVKPMEPPIYMNRACPPKCKGIEPNPTRKEWENG